MRLNWLILSLYLIVSISAAGCGGSSNKDKSLDMGGEEGSKIASLIDDLADFKNNPKKLPSICDESLKLTEPKKFGSYSYYVVGKPTVNGDTATCTIRIDDAGGTKLFEKEWEFVKRGNNWKIKSCPIA
jgi:hypothetical protein